ncbi:MAG: phage tail sheath subtilisin-like domain-containing protein, partial [Chloroflexaceae bacterium]|nr:phage tail sheath subtilisin-like domain-containing protein [Chloroflexaceae bacterium]
MPEYLAPGVYVEEVSFRSKSIEGVSTSTAGFVGPTRYGPVSGEPELLTSFADFERIYGGLDDLGFGTNYLAHAVRVFFDEGGKRLFVSRVFGAGEDGFALDDDNLPAQHYGAFAPPPPDPPPNPLPPPPFRVVARFPGAAGNMRLRLTLRLGANGVTTVNGQRTLQRVRPFDLVLVRTTPAAADTPGSAVPDGDGLRIATLDTVSGTWALVDLAHATPERRTMLLNDAQFDNAEVRPVTVLVEVTRPSANPLVVNPPELLGEFGFDPRSSNGLLATFSRAPGTRLAALTAPFALFSTVTDQTLQGLALARALFATTAWAELLRLAPAEANLRAEFNLTGGDDGAAPTAVAYSGQTPFNDFINDALAEPKNGLLAFEGIEDISIVAAPGYSATADATERAGIHAALISHAERMRYRVAVLDTPPRQLPSGALEFRNQRSSKYAALYYPWVTIADPRGSGRLDLPPSGFVAGIYARNDVEHAVFKAPANEVVRSAIDFELRLNKAQQEILNPEGVNCFRFFEGRGYLLWGARTISDDPE